MALAFDKTLNIDPNCPSCKQYIKKCSCLPEPSKIKLTPKKPPVEEPTKLQKSLTTLGYIFTAIIALGCGVMVAGAFITLSLLSPGTASYLIAGLLFVAGTVVNWLIYKNSVPIILVGLFGKEKWFQGLFEVPGGCDLVVVDKKPEKGTRLPIHSAHAYLRVKSKDGKEDSLYIVTKETGVCKKIKNLTPEILARFDKELGTKNKKLKYVEQLKITEITGHSLLSRKKKASMVIGFFLALAAGIMQGVLTFNSTFTLTNAFAFLAVISPAFPPIAGVLAAITIISLTAVLLRNIADWVKTHDVVEDFKSYCKELFDFTSPRCELIVRDEVPKAGRLHELRLAYDSAYVRVKNKLFYVDKETNQCIELRMVPFLSKEFDAKLKIDGKPLKRDLSFAEVAEISRLAGHKTKSRARLLTERALTLLLTLVALPLAALGVYMTMNACAAATKVFLLKSIPNASAMIVDVASKVLGLGMAFLGRIPFTFRNTIRTLGHFIDSKLDKSSRGAEKKSKESHSVFWYLWEGVKTVALYTLCFINAIGNGLISMVGAGRSAGPTWGGVIGGSGTLNSLTAGVASGLLGSGGHKHDDQNEELLLIDAKLKKNPSDTSLLYKKANIHAHKEEWDDAISSLNALIVLQPQNKEALTLLAKMEKLKLRDTKVADDSFVSLSWTAGAEKLKKFHKPKALPPQQTQNTAPHLHRAKTGLTMFPHLHQGAKKVMPEKRSRSDDELKALSF